MASYQLPLLPVISSKIAPLEKKSPFLATKTFNVPCPIQCRVSSDVSSNNSQTILRRSPCFRPSIWHYDYIQSLNNGYKEELYTRQSTVLKEQVRMMLCKVVNHLDQLELIDVLQRLGVAYHFDNEIKNILENVYSNIDILKRDENLYATALAFRLIRHYGYYLSTDVFDSFQDKRGNFKRCLSFDVKGLLSLYEASFHSEENETILDEARDFSSKLLKEFVNKNNDDDISVLISHALELPLRWRILRWEALWFTDVYERRNDVNHTLLQFAKLDFNRVQSIHQEELKYTSRWWKRIGLVDAQKLSLVRDRLMENFFSGLGLNFRPNLGNFRRGITKVNSLATIIDDIYDSYGTLEELKLFTEVIDSWDLNAMDRLPNYLKTCFFALYNLVNEIAFDNLKTNGCSIIPILKRAWFDYCKSKFIEAKWYYSGYTPSLQEYLENGWLSIGTVVVVMHGYFLIPNSFNKEDLVSLEEEYPNIIRLSAIISRLVGDLGTCEREMETGDVPKAIQCYMNETGASEVEASEHLKCTVHTTWKKMNEEARKSSLCGSFIDVAVNFARMTHLYYYQYVDGFTVQDPKTKSCILSLIVQPIPYDFSSTEKLLKST